MRCKTLASKAMQLSSVMRKNNPPLLIGIRAGVMMLPRVGPLTSS